MNESLARLLDKARKITPSALDREQQRRSFAYGNTHFENERITREMVDQAADEIAKEKK